MKDRIKTLRKNLGLTQEKFADRLSMKRNTIANYEIGRNEPIDAVISLMCREFHVSERWLRTGEGEMFVSRPPEDEVGYYVEELLEEEDNPLYKVIIEMMKTYQGLDEKSKTVIKNYFQQIGDAISKKEEEKA